MPVFAAYTTLRPGSVARTVEVNDGLNVDVDSEGRVLGVEVIGEGDWRDALAFLAAQGRLRVA